MNNIVSVRGLNEVKISESYILRTYHLSCLALPAIWLTEGGDCRCNGSGEMGETVRFSRLASLNVSAPAGGGKNCEGQLTEIFRVNLLAPELFFF